MTDALEFLVRHGYWLLFAAILVDQLGLPFPALPFLLASGAVARSGRIDLAAAILLGTAAAIAAHLVWYEAGRRKGGRILKLVCRVSVEPDACVRQTQDVFSRHGSKSLLVARFVPGVDVVAPPLAGTSGMSRGRFLALDGAGALLWAGSQIALGYAFSEQLETVAALAVELGTKAMVLVAALAALWIGFKVLQRRRLIARLRIARITPEQLHAKLAAGEDVAIIDLRHRFDHEVHPRTLPGAIRIPAEEIETRHGEIPRGREVVLYCS